MNNRFLFIGADEHLKRELQKRMPELDIVMGKPDSGFEKGYNFSTVVISDKEVQPLGLSQFVEMFEGAKIFYLISSSLKTSVIDNKITICQQCKVTPIHPKQTLSQIVERILGLSNKKNDEKKIIGFLGTHSQSGTTMTTLSVANIVKNTTNLSVAVLGLNSFNPGTLFMNYEAPTIDEFYDLVTDTRRKVTPDEIKNFVHTEANGLVYLAGNQDFTKRNYYNEDDIEHIIKIFSEQYDILFLDVGSAPDSNLAIQGLLSSDMKILVATQQPLSTKLWTRMNSDILRLINITSDEFLLVINKYRPDFPWDSRNLQNQTGVPVISTVPDFSAEGMVCELERKLLINSRDNNVKKKSLESYSKIADVILKSLKPSTNIIKENKKPTLFSKFRFKEGVK